MPAIEITAQRKTSTIGKVAVGLIDDAEKENSKLKRLGKQKLHAPERLGRWLGRGTGLISQKTKENPASLRACLASFLFFFPRVWLNFELASSHV